MEASAVRASLLSSRAVAKAAWGSGDAHVQSTAMCRPRLQAFGARGAPRLILWLCLEAKPKRALGPGATIGVLGTGVPRLACLRPTAWLCCRPVWPTFINKAFKTLTRAKPREADDARPPQERPCQAASRGAEISRKGKPHEALVT